MWRRIFASLSSRRAWIEILLHIQRIIQINASLSSRRAWIEIVCLAKSFMSACVALLTESVDWNVYQSAFWHLWFWVALLTESVDWNVLIRPIGMTTIRRSPHGERGLKYCMIFNRSILWSWSLSSRRAWIEIKYDGEFIQSSICRSPHGERGLKCCSRGVKRPKVESLSSRRAWIEMDLIQSGLTYPLQVALLTESVDWNNKSSYLFIKHCMSLSSRRAWIEILIRSWISTSS